MKRNKWVKRLLSVGIAAAVLWGSIPMNALADGYALIGDEIIDMDATADGRLGGVMALQV